MKKHLFTLAFLACATLLFAQNSPIHILRTNDNFQYLKNDTTAKRGHEKLKLLPIGPRKTVRFSLGGEVREQVQHFENFNFGDVPPVFETPSFTQLWHRVLLHGDLELGKKWRVFGQTNHTLLLFTENPPIEIDENQLGLHQFFVEMRPTKSIGLRVGRQELGYGNNRLLTFREGPNNRLAFDGAVAKWQSPRWKVDAMLVFPVFQQPEINDDRAFEDQILGIYATQTLLPKRLFVDWYALDFRGKRLKYGGVAGDERRGSLGFRLFTKNKNQNAEVEATYQTGRFDGLKINALAIAFDANFRFGAAKKTTLGIAGNYITGDQNPSDGQLNTYNLLFSKPSFGLAAPIGASNIVNLNPYFRWQPQPKWQFQAGVYFLSKQSTDDGTYTPGMGLVRPARPDIAAKKLGNQYALQAEFQATRQWSFAADFAYFAPAEFVEKTGKGQPISYFSAKAAFKF